MQAPVGADLNLLPRIYKGFGPVPPG